MLPLKKQTEINDKQTATVWSAFLFPEFLVKLADFKSNEYPFSAQPLAFFENLIGLVLSFTK